MSAVQLGASHCSDSPGSAMVSHDGSAYSGSAMAMLRELDRNIWVAERPQRFYGLEVGTRMTVIRLADGSLEDVQ